MTVPSSSRSRSFETPHTAFMTGGVLDRSTTTVDAVTAVHEAVERPATVNTQPDQPALPMFVSATKPSKTVPTVDSAVDALTEQLREKLDVSWTCVSLVFDTCLDQQQCWTTKSVADRKGMPLFATIDNNNNNNNSTQIRPHVFAINTNTTSSLLEEQEEETKVVEVHDTWQDERFRDNPYVQTSAERPYSVRFYASAPIISMQCGSNQGKRIGTIGVCTHEPKYLTLAEKMLIQDQAFRIGNLLSSPTGRSSRGEGSTTTRVKRARKRSTSRDDSEIGRRHTILEDGSSKTTPSPKRRSASCGPTPLLSVLSTTDAKSTVSSTSNFTTTIIENPSTPKIALPDPKTSTADPDLYLAQLVKALSAPSGTIQLSVKPSHTIADYFPEVAEEQMARYSVNVVTMARNNDVAGIKSLFAECGRDALDCYNRFGEGLLTLACRRGFRDLVGFFLSAGVDLPVRVRDDYGRTPVHDACWNPTPQLEICAWIMARDPSLFLLADKRGFTAFQYARQSDWHIWRQFLHDHHHLLLPFLTQPDLAKRFAP